MPKKKKTKKVYDSQKVCFCPTCGSNTLHLIYDWDKGIYKCIICNTVHA